MTYGSSTRSIAFFIRSALIQDSLQGNRYMSFVAQCLMDIRNLNDYWLVLLVESNLGVDASFELPSPRHCFCPLNMCLGLTCSGWRFGQRLCLKQSFVGLMPLTLSAKPPSRHVFGQRSAAYLYSLSQELPIVTALHLSGMHESKM